MSRSNFENGMATQKEFWDFMQERHNIWHKRFVLKQPKPWTEDEVLRDYKFTNCFRQLDRGTIALHDMFKNAANGCNFKRRTMALDIFNICWYRIFNVDQHAENCGYVSRLEDIQHYFIRIHAEKKAGEPIKVWTGAHLTYPGNGGQTKIDFYLDAVKEFWEDIDVLVDACSTNKMEVVYETLKQYQTVGNFIAYEIVCDLRFLVMDDPVDVNTWANIGPGAKRGLQRLGMDVSVQSMIDLYKTGRRLRWHDCGWPFELREIEHCLCEFDKYVRTKTGEGRPRSKYDGRAECE